VNFVDQFHDMRIYVFCITFFKKSMSDDAKNVLNWWLQIGLNGFVVIGTYIYETGERGGGTIFVLPVRFDFHSAKSSGKSFLAQKDGSALSSLWRVCGGWLR
jgi:hypothetical protein